MFNYLLSYCKCIFWVTMIKYDDTKKYKYESLLFNVKQCGCIPIKFIQWILPFLYILMDKKYYEYLDIFKDAYENCNFHSLEYTKEIYKKNFDSDMGSEYKEIIEINSGSIGQIYRVVDNDDKIYAIKVIHPGVLMEMKVMEYIVKIIVSIMNIKIINIHEFFTIFKKQTDFINESNNLLYFYNNYIDYDDVVIPRLFKVSKDIIIMEYIDDDGDISENDYKACMLIGLFVINSLYNQQLNHGDLHPGNLKMMGEKIVLYDFGYCWENLRDKKILDNLNDATLLYHYKIDGLVEKKRINFHDFLKLNKIENIEKHMDEYCEIETFQEYIQFLIIIYYKNNQTIDIFILNLILSIVHINKHTENYCNIIDSHNFLKTYGKFPEYLHYIERDIRKYKLLDIDKDNEIEKYDLKKFL